MDRPDLTIPHSRLAERKFVLAPLVEIAPEAIHPVLGKSAAELFQELRNTHTVVKCKLDCTLS
jgi:2-amino-4-hydroxy-6-hydroxymethyldihydropteridine diphosphokinase